MSEKFCPLFSISQQRDALCIGSLCAWWCSIDYRTTYAGRVDEKCAILKIAESLAEQ